MYSFMQMLKIQRWDDHRFYHHSLINQSLHLLSATSFVLMYFLLFWDPVIAAMTGWMVSMTSRQIGHFFFRAERLRHGKRRHSRIQRRGQGRL
jgi:hypothetical protein